MNDSFPRLVESAFRDLIQRGMIRKISEEYDPDSFGNYVGMFEADGFRIRVVRDRTEVYADLASNSDQDNWIDLRRLVSSAIWPSGSSERDSYAALEGIAAIIQSNLDLIIEMLSLDRYAETRERLDRLGNLTRARLERFSKRPK